MTQNPMNIVRKEIKEKLEDKCAEITSLLLQGRTDSDINEYLWLANFHGFSDVAEILNQTRSNLAGMIIDSHNQPRKRIKQEERKLEDYVSKNGNLNKVEQGLEFVERQFSTRAGDIDILAKDSQGKEVLVELKTPVGKYDKNTALDEVRGYLEDRQDARAILAVPYIDFWLYSRLKGFVDNDRLKILLVNQKAQDYEFRDLQETDVKVTSRKQKRAIRRTIKKRGEESNILSLVRQVREVQEPEPKETGRFEGGEEIEQGTFHDENLSKRPFYYQVLAIARPKIKDRERYLQPIEVSSEQMEGLESLVKSREVDSIVEDLEHLAKIREWEAILNGLGDKTLVRDFNQIEGKISFAAYNKMKQYSDTFSFLRDSFGEAVLGIISAETPEQIEFIMRASKGYSRHLSRVYTFARYTDKDMRKARVLCRKLKREFYGIKEPRKRRIARWSIESLSSRQDFLGEECSARSVSLRARRTEKLMEIDPNLALAYLGYCFVHGCYSLREIQGEKISEEERNEGFKGFVVGVIPYAEFVRADTELYQNILNEALRVREEPRQVAEAQVEQVISPHEAPVKPEPEISPYERDKDRLHAAILNNHVNALSEDEKLRVDYFIGDILDRGYSGEKLQQLCDSFSGFNLGRRLRRREERPQEIQFRNFFDDVTLGYVIKGKLPTSEDLEGLYKKDCKA